MNSKKVSEKISELRKSHNLTLSDMGTKLGIATSAYRNIEIGETSLTLERLYQFSEIFGVSVGELLGLEGVPQSKVDALGKEMEEIQYNLKRIVHQRQSKLEDFQKLENQYLEVIDNLVNSVFFAFEKWYFNTPPKTMSKEIISREDTSFWIQFFSFRGNSLAFAFDLVLDGFFNEMYQAHKKLVKEGETFPTQEREVCMHDLWYNLLLSKEAKDMKKIKEAFEALNKFIEKDGYALVEIH